MKKCITLISLIILFSGFTYAQNWQCVNADRSFTFLADTLIRAIRVDSTCQSNYSTYFFFFNSIQPLNTQCFLPDAPAWLGKYMIACPSGLNYFFNSSDDTLIINTIANFGESWIFYQFPDSGYYIESTVTATIPDTLIEEPDSVKIISLQVKNSLGENVESELNNYVLELSKDHGLTSTFSFYRFPQLVEYNENQYHVAGMTSPEQGILNLTLQDVFNYEIGDEFHSSYKHYYSNFFGGFIDSLVNSVSVVTGKILYADNDSITYIQKVSRFTTHYYQSGGHTSALRYEMDTVTYNFIPDYPKVLIPFLMNQYSIPESRQYVNLLSEECAVIDSVNRVSTTQYKSEFYNQRLFKEISYFDDEFGCFTHNLWWPQNDTPEYRFISGCGGPYYEWWSHPWYEHAPASEEYNKLDYFKKGSETWGTPFDTTNWIVSNSTAENQPHQVQFQLYPNPANELLTVEIPQSKQGNYKLVIYSLPGSVIDELNVDSGKFTLNVSKYSPGIYFYMFYLDNKLIGGGKFAKY